MKSGFKKTAKKTAVARTKKATSTVKELAKVKASIKKLTTISYDKVQMQMSGYNNQAVVQPYYQYHLNGLMQNWTPIFGYDSGDFSTVNKCYVNSYKVDARLKQSSEADLIWYTAFVVSLKDDGADSTTFDPATGTLTLALNTHYNSLGASGKTLLNPRFFNIHSYKRFSMGGRSGDQSNPVQRDLSFTIVPKEKLITNPKGNIFGSGGLQFPKDPSKNYYLLLFNDDSAGDLQYNEIVIGGLASLAIPN
jgi:hypothetical protein